MHLKKRLYKIAPPALKIITSLLVMSLAIQLLGPINFSTSAFEFEASLKLWGKGRTLLYFPPLGKIIATTHWPPLDFHLLLVNIHFDELTALTGNFSLTDFLSNSLLYAIKISLIKYMIFLFLLAFLLGIASSFFLARWRTGIKELLMPGLINVVVLAFFISTAILSYNTAAFSEAEYQGALEAAPWILHVLQEGKDIVNNIGFQFTEIIENISFLEKEMKTNIPLNGPQNEPRDTIKVLHISDIHNNPAAFDFIQRVVDTFNVQLIIDTGDLVDYGTDWELGLFQQNIQEIKIPYIFIPGNHDSPLIIEQLQGFENVNVLENGAIDMMGLKIIALADPASSSTSPSLADDTLLEEKAKLLAEKVNDSEEVTLIAAHNPQLFKYLRQGGNLLLGGHLHHPFVKKNEEYIEINAGSTGASGIRGLQKMKISFSLVLLDFHYSEQKQSYIPFSADLIKVEQLPLNFSLERFIFVD